MILIITIFALCHYIFPYICPSHRRFWELSWSWSYGSLIYNYLCNRWSSPLTLWVRVPFMGRYFVIKSVSDFRQVTPVSSTNKTDRHDITEILLEMALSSITLTQHRLFTYMIYYLHAYYRHEYRWTYTHLTSNTSQ